MRGPEHFLEAERLVEVAEYGPNRAEYAQTALAAAQVHATLAQVAATIEAAAGRGPGDVSREWIEAVK